MHIEHLVENEIVQLHNDGNLEIIWLGVGSAFSFENAQTNALIIKGDQHIMLDFGSGAPVALWNVCKLGLGDITTYLPTHSHEDHVGGLEKVAAYNRYITRKQKGGDKVKLIIDPDYEDKLWNRTLRGGLEWNEETTNGSKMTLHNYFNIIRPQAGSRKGRDTWTIDVGDIHIEMFRTKHYPDTAVSWRDAFRSVGVMIDNRVFISMDTMFDQNLIETYEANAEILFHDATFYTGGVHASVQELSQMSPDIKKRMRLIHYPDNWYENERNVKDASIGGFAKSGIRYIFD